MHNIPDKRYFETKSADSGFRAPELEKVYRIMLILSEINRGLLKELLALRGGTAINLCFEELPRLSVDIDLAAIRNGDKERMLKNKDLTRRELTTILSGARYKYEEHFDDYALDRFDVKYRNTFGSPDRIKIEINYISSRIPIYGVTSSKPYNIFDISTEEVQTLSIVETYGSKIEALFKRHTPRDLFDVYLLTKHKDKVETSKLRKCTIFSCCIEIPQDFRSSLQSTPADTITEKQVNDKLRPYLHRDFNFELNSVKETVGEFCAKLLRLESGEQKFLNTFLQDKKYLPELLFPNESHLQDHSGIKWRLQQMNSQDAP